MTGMTIVGIDPGIDGGIAFLNGHEIETHYMPVFRDPKGKRVLNLHMTAKLLLPRNNRNIAIIEKVWGRQNDGAPNAFRFGQRYGALEMALAGHGYELHYVTPPVWKKHFRISSDKGEARGLATERFPGAASEFHMVKDDGRAEAALVALYGAEKLVFKAAA